MRLDPRSADLGVSGEDVYQVLACARRYATVTAVAGVVGEAVGPGWAASKEAPASSGVST